MKIALLGGGFNPPHIGHQIICQQVLDFTSNQQVWLLPYFQHPWSKPSLDSETRYEMCKILEEGRIKVSDLEIKMKKKNFTYQTVDMITSLYPQHDFSWVIGSDLYQEFFTWEHAQDICKKMKILVFPRAGWLIGPLKENVYTIKCNLLITSDISSEKIRKMVKQGLSVKGLVAPKIEEYIKRHGLYR